MITGRIVYITILTCIPYSKSVLVSASPMYSSTILLQTRRWCQGRNIIINEYIGVVDTRTDIEYGVQEVQETTKELQYIKNLITLLTRLGSGLFQSQVEASLGTVLRYLEKKIVRSQRSVCFDLVILRIVTIDTSH